MLDYQNLEFRGVERIVVAGDRNWRDYETIKQTLYCFKDLVTVIHGGCRGADNIAGTIASSTGKTVKTYKANWDKDGKAARPIRNNQMLDEKPDMLVAFHSDLDSSKGTKHIVNEALNRNIRVLVITEELRGRLGSV